MARDLSQLRSDIRHLLADGFEKRRLIERAMTAATANSRPFASKESAEQSLYRLLVNEGSVSVWVEEAFRMALNGRLDEVAPAAQKPRAEAVSEAFELAQPSERSLSSLLLEAAVRSEALEREIHYLRIQLRLEGKHGS